MKIYNYLFYNFYKLFNKKNHPLSASIIILSFTQFTHFATINLLYGIFFEVRDFHLSFFNLIFTSLFGLFLSLYLINGKKYEIIIQNFDKKNVRFKIQGKIISIFYLIVSIIIMIVVARIRFNLLNDII